MLDRQQNRAAQRQGVSCQVGGLVWILVFVIPLHAARRAMAAAACRCPSQARNSSLFPPTGIPLSYPRTSLRSHNGGFPTSPSPHVRQKAQTNTKGKSKTPPSPPYLNRDRRKGSTHALSLLHGPVLLSSHLLRLDLRHLLLLSARGLSTWSPPLPSWWGW